MISQDEGYTTLWKGLLGGQQFIFRAELLAGGVAVGAFSKVQVFSDCLSFVRIARRLANDWQAGRRPRMPSKHRGLWQYFWRHHLTRCDIGQVDFQWIPAHGAMGNLVGREAFEARLNDVADSEAKGVLAAFVRRSEAYTKLQLRRTGLERSVPRSSRPCTLPLPLEQLLCRPHGVRRNAAALRKSRSSLTIRLHFSWSGRESRFAILSTSLASRSVFARLGGLPHPVGVRWLIYVVG